MSVVTPRSEVTSSMITGSHRSFLHATPFAFGKSAPDPEPLVVGECVLEALHPDVTGQADPLGLSGRPALLREEGLRVGLSAQGTLLPLQLFHDLIGRLRQRRRVQHCRHGLVHLASSSTLAPHRGSPPYLRIKHSKC